MNIIKPTKPIKALVNFTSSSLRYLENTCDNQQKNAIAKIKNVAKIIIMDKTKSVAKIITIDKTKSVVKN